jgi:hypothetical protein
MSNRAQSVLVILALLLVILILCWVFELGAPWDLLGDLAVLVWKIVLLPIWYLIVAAIDVVFHFLAVIVGVFIALALAITGLFAAAALVVLGVSLITKLATRQVGSQFRELHARLDRSDRLNVFLVFFFFMLPTLLAVLLPVRGIKGIHNPVTGVSRDRRFLHLSRADHFRPRFD